MEPAGVTPDEVPDFHNLKVGWSSTARCCKKVIPSLMIFLVRRQVAHMSRKMMLEPGEVMITGTPASIGAAGTPLRSCSEEIEHGNN
jgi:2-keto-4-pentenoate hydratase/2-oxohepta-3-ene-1,7-dioic acid hydratase in catechol pathway